MDTDCLIKLTKAGLKDFIGNRDDIFIRDIYTEGGLKRGR